VHSSWFDLEEEWAMAHEELVETLAPEAAGGGR
jgi:hypothetical protein